MPSSTTNYALPYSVATDAVNPPSDFAALATAVDTTIKAQVSRPACILVLAANFTVTTTATITSIPFPGAEVLDDLNWHNPASNPSRIVPTLPGRYLVNLNAMFAANATGDRRCYVEKNGAQGHIFARSQNQGANSMSLSATGLVICNGTTDFIEGAAFQASGAALDMLGAGDATFSTSIEVIYLGNL